MNLKRLLSVGAIIVVILAVPLLTAGLMQITKPEPAMAATDSTTTNVISVNGQGTVSVSPDIAYVTLGIETRAKTAEEAQKDNAAAFEKLQKTLLEDFNIDKKDIKTTNFQVQPVYSYENQEQKIKEYRTSHFIQISYRELDKIGSLLDAASEAGANRINGIQFDTEKRSEYELEAIKNAMANAEAKAKVIAEYAGKDLKDIIQVSQDTSFGGGPIYYNSAEMVRKADSTSISVGQIDVTTTVHVQYNF